MFCPLCKAEYREGFTRCASCDVDLVPSWPLEGVVEPKGNLVLLWRGREFAFFSQLAHVLGEASIACHVRKKMLHSPEEVFEGPLVVGNEFEVRVFEHDLTGARRILDEQTRLFASQPESEAEAQSDEAVAEVLPEPYGTPTDEDILECDAQGPDSEAWSGEDSAHAKFIRDALRENEVGYRTVIEQTGHERIMVRAEDAPRAREIIREVFEGVPPEEAEP